MAQLSFDHVMFRTPALVSCGGALITWHHIHVYSFDFLYVFEAALLVWLGYRFVQPRKHEDLKIERPLLLTALFVLFGTHGFPCSLAVAGLILYFYHLPANISLRNIPLIKNISIALAWICCTTALMFRPTSEFYLVFFADFLLIFGLSLLSDIRDRMADQGQIKTLVHSIGLLPTALLSYVCIAAFLLIHIPFAFNITTLGTLLTCLVFIAPLPIWFSIYKTHRQATIAIDLCLSVLPLIVALV
jgi:uncharacterized protein with PQ loop repeat